MAAVETGPGNRWRAVRAWATAGLLLTLPLGLAGPASAAVAGAGSARDAAAIAGAGKVAAPKPSRGAGNAGPASLKGHRHARVCGVPAKRRAACDAVVDLDVSGPLAASSAVPSGYGPADLQAAYSLPSAASGRGVTVAIVDAYDAPTAAADLAAYRSQYGLPPCGAGCFTKLNQNGGTALPPVNAGWAQETSLDLDMVAATCPNCSILLVEANSSSVDDLGAAVNTAVRLGAVAVSNSYGAPETASQTTLDAKYYNHPGVAITASSGDSGYGVEYPAASQYVTAVGGTSLTRDTSARGWHETVWGSSTAGAIGAGSGCSLYDPKPTWQHDSGCAQGRTVADVAAVADPSTGVAVFDSTSSNNQSGWLVFGGTSAASPVIAATYALAGTPAQQSYPAAQPYLALPAAFNDVTSGSNGSCAVRYLCTGGPGYDGPTGLGTPRGVAGFNHAASAAGDFHPVGPLRVLDTRVGNGAVQAPVAAGASLKVQIEGVHAIPASGVSAVVLNVTVTQPTAGGYITAYPDGATRPTASNLNFNRAQTVPNLVVVPVGADGKITLYNGSAGTVQLIGDIAGYYLSGPPATAGAFGPIGPTRVLDTRTGTGAAPSPVAALSSVSVQVTGVDAVPASGVSAVVLNVTVTQPTAGGYITAYPDGATRPTASNLNFNRAQTVPNLVVVPVGADGKITLYNGSAGTVQLIGDIAGYYLSGPPATAGAFGPTGPTRVLDTRTGTGAVQAPIAAGASLTVQIEGAHAIPASGISAVVLNVTVTQPTAGGYITAYPDGATRPTASNLNFNPAQTVPNLVVVPVGADGKITLYNGSAGTVQLIGDIAGYYLGAPPP